MHTVHLTHIQSPRMCCHKHVGATSRKSWGFPLLYSFGFPPVSLPALSQRSYSSSSFFFNVRLCRSLLPAAGKSPPPRRRFATVSTSSEIYTALRNYAVCTDGELGRLACSHSLTPSHQSIVISRQPHRLNSSCTTTANLCTANSIWTNDNSSFANWNLGSNFVFTIASCSVNHRSKSFGNRLSRESSTLNKTRPSTASNIASEGCLRPFKAFHLANVQCTRLFASMATSTSDTSHTQLIDEARKYIRSQQLGAYIDGHWIAHDADPSRFPERLLQLLQHPQRAHPHEHINDRPYTRQDQTGKHQKGTQEHETEETLPVSAFALASFDVKDPATGETVCLMPALDTPYVRAAIAAAGRAQHTVWGRQQAPPARRYYVLKAWERLVEAEKEPLARVLVLETGKPLPEARGEVLYASSFIGWFAEQLRRDNGIVIPSPTGTQALMTACRQPVGVCALITPWNMPVAMLTRKAAAALAAGCCCVCKLPTDAPLTALCLGRLAERAGIPPGVLNMVTTDHKGARLFAQEVSRQPIVRKISFTGSTKVGKLLMQQAALTMKRVSLELGGNAPFIIFEDANVDEAVQALVACKFRNAGQTCVCANRVYVHRGIWDKFVPALVKLVSELVVGHGFVHGVSIGPLINVSAREKVERLVTQAVAFGGKVLSPLEAAISTPVSRDNQDSVASAFKAAEQLVDSLRKSLPDQLRGNEESSFFPPVVLDCRAFDGVEVDAMRSLVRKDGLPASAAVASAGERLVKRESSGLLRQFSSRSEHLEQGGEGQQTHHDLYPEMLQTEIFGPVLPLYSFSDEAEVVRRANATKAGLAAYVCTRDLYRVPRVTAALEAGLVGVNTGIISTAEAPFGGIKESGMGREGSVYGLDEYTELKYICVGGGAETK